MLELPISIWMVFIVFLIPMIALGSITIRATLLNIAVQDAVQAAAKMRTFEGDTPDGPSAISVAAATFQKRIGMFSGITSDPIDLDIIQTGIVAPASLRFENRLPVPADNSAFLYQVEGAVSARIDPIFPVADHTGARIAGLTTPMRLRYSARQMFENPQGLHR